MNLPMELEPGLEPERYELDEPLPYRFDLDRRDFLKVAGGGIFVFSVLRADASQQPGGRRRQGGGQNLPQDLGAWLHIAEDGKITVYTGKVEVGQNIRTSLTQVVAEELRIALDSIQLVMADTQLTPFDRGTSGSQTTPTMARQLRRVAATARETLLDLAVDAMKTIRTNLSVADGKVTDSQTGRSLGFGSLTKGQKLTKTVADSPVTTPAADWKIVGHDAAKVNGKSIVTGQHKYSSDIKLPGTMFGKILRPPAFGSTLVSVDASAAEKMPGVKVVHDGDFVGVVAPTEHDATKACKAIKAEWKSTPQVSGKELFTYLRNQVKVEQAKPSQENALDAKSNNAESDPIRLKATYTVAYIAHAPLEPRAAVANWENNKLTVWTGTQQPFRVRGDLASTFRIPATDVRVIVPDTGSGYGGKHSGEAAIEAARLAKAAAAPVKLVWTREEEFTWAYFRPAGVIEVASGVRKDGTLTEWEFHNFNSGGSSIRSLYDVPKQRTQFHQVRYPLRQGSYRALAATANHFARESHMDELAHIVKMDPLEFRLKNLKDERMRAVLQAAAAKFGWNKASALGNGVGLACGFDKGSYVATCAEIAIDKTSGAVNVVRAVTAFECGAVLNPDHLKNQAEGALMMGIGGALFEAVEFDKGKILNPRFANYRVPRFSDTPQIEVVLLDRKDLPSAGAGETPVVAIAPAIANAIFAQTGQRIRSMPLAPHGIRA